MIVLIVVILLIIAIGAFLMYGTEKNYNENQSNIQNLNKNDSVNETNISNTNTQA